MNFIYFKRAFRSVGYAFMVFDGLHPYGGVSPAPPRISKGFELVQSY